MRSDVTNMTDSVYLWKEDVLIAGDTVAYKNLVYELTFKQVNHWDLLYYAQLMCNKYNYPAACNECYRINHEEYSPTNRKTYDSLTYRFGIYYLLKAYELGDFESQFIVKRYFGENIPTSKDYLGRISAEK